MDDDVISVGEELPRLLDVEVLHGRRVAVHWMSSDSCIVDLLEVLPKRKIFAPLIYDDELFATARVNEDRSAIEWDGGIEMPALWLEMLCGEPL